MSYADDAFTWFEHPDFGSNQETLQKRNMLLKNAIRQNEAFNIDNVFDASKQLPEQKLETPNFTGNDQFSAFAANNPIPKDLFGTDKADIDTGKKPSNFLGTQGEGESGAIAGLGMEAIKDFSGVSNSEGQSITDGLNLGMKGAQAGMAVAGPAGAIVGGAAGIAAGAIDYFGDADKRHSEERKKNRLLTEKAHTKLEQEQRQKDGLDSLSNLTALRKEQEKFII